MPMQTFNQQFNSVFNSTCFNSAAADRYTHQLDEVRAKKELLDSIARGDYSIISKDTVEAEMKKSNVVIGLVTQLAEAYNNGASPLVIDTLTESICKARNRIIANILESRSHQEVA